MLTVVLGVLAVSFVDNSYFKIDSLAGVSEPVHLADLIKYRCFLTSSPVAQGALYRQAKMNKD